VRQNKLVTFLGGPDLGLGAGYGWNKRTLKAMFKPKNLRKSLYSAWGMTLPVKKTIALAVGEWGYGKLKGRLKRVTARRTRKTRKRRSR
jgi:hypothetical protein